MILLRTIVSGITLGALALVGLQPTWARHEQRSLSPEAAPQSWVAYAERVNKQVTVWLTDSGDAAQRLHAYIDATRSAPDQASAPLALKPWIDRTGKITKVAFAPFADEQANADLHGLLIGRAIGALPPERMLQPLRLAVQLTPSPPPGPSQSLPIATQRTI